MKVFYHNDMDGKCSGAIVNKFYKEADIRQLDPPMTMDEIMNPNTHKKRLKRKYSS